MCSRVFKLEHRTTLAFLLGNGPTPSTLRQATSVVKYHDYDAVFLNDSTARSPSYPSVLLWLHDTEPPTPKSSLKETTH